jgi:hypothetical protein
MACFLFDVAVFEPIWPHLFQHWVVDPKLPLGAINIHSPENRLEPLKPQGRRRVLVGQFLARDRFQPRKFAHRQDRASLEPPCLAELLAQPPHRLGLRALEHFALGRRLGRRCVRIKARNIALKQVADARRRAAVVKPLVEVNKVRFRWGLV